MAQTLKQKAALIAAAVALATPIVRVSEGLIPHVYKDPVGIPTVCYGHTGRDLVYGKSYTPDECRGILDKDLQTAIRGVMSCAPLDVLTPGQLAAFADFTLNAGTGRFCGSTMSRLIREGKPLAACDELGKWVYAGGKILPGLVTRRKREMEICKNASITTD